MFYYVNITKKEVQNFMYAFVFFLIISLVAMIALEATKESKSKKTILNNPFAIILAILYFPTGVILALAKNFK